MTVGVHGRHGTSGLGGNFGHARMTITVGRLMTDHAGIRKQELGRQKMKPACHYKCFESLWALFRSCLCVVHRVSCHGSPCSGCGLLLEMSNIATTPCARTIPSATK
jgi:hypothetical protein